MAFPRSLVAAGVLLLCTWPAGVEGDLAAWLAALKIEIPPLSLQKDTVNATVEGLECHSESMPPLSASSSAGFK